MATVADSLPFATVRTELETYLGITIPPGDLKASLLWAAVADYMDTYLNNPFVDSDGVDVAIPDSVKGACYEMLKQVILGVFERKPGLFNVKTGDLSETYGLLKQGEELDAAHFEVAARNVKPMVWRYRKKLHL